MTGWLAVPQTSAWGQFSTVTKTGLALSSGRNVLRVESGPNDFWDFDSMQLQ